MENINKFYLDVLKKKYALFDGRASVREFWMFWLFHFIAYVALIIVGTLISVSFLLAGIYALALVVPTIAITCRRLHDVGQSGWMQLIGFIPFGVLYLIFMHYIKPGTPGDNKFGANPSGM